MKMETNKIYQGDCMEVMQDLPENSVDSIVTDPPYGLSFMNKGWDRFTDNEALQIWTEQWAKEAKRVLKPGGHMLCFGGTRTYHRIACGIEDAGFQIRDQIQWVYGSGFPKSRDIGKDVDEIQGNEREVVGTEEVDVGIQSGSMHAGRDSKVVERNQTQGFSEWEGWGTALKPAHEPIALARKPLAENSIAENVLRWRTGGLNIDECRIEGSWERSTPHIGNIKGGNYQNTQGKIELGEGQECHPAGRFPANFIHDGSKEVMDLFPETDSSNVRKPTYKKYAAVNTYEGPYDKTVRGFNDFGGSAARFFYCPKAKKKERDKGLNGFKKKQTKGGGGLTATKDEEGYYKTASAAGKFGSIKAPKKNHHPTVKPLELMKYLCRLITPKEGIVLDPFAGSGTTCMAAKAERFKYLGIEKEKEYVDIARARVEATPVYDDLTRYME